MIWIAIIILAIIVIAFIEAAKKEQQYNKLESEVLKTLGLSNWDDISYFDEHVTVKSRQTLEKYDDIKFFKENKEMAENAEKIIGRKNEMTIVARKFLESNEYESHPQYARIVKQIDALLKNAGAFRIKVSYISSAGKDLGSKTIAVDQYDIERFQEDPALLMEKEDTDE